MRLLQLFRGYGGND